MLAGRGGERPVYPRSQFQGLQPAPERPYCVRVQFWTARPGYGLRKSDFASLFFIFKVCVSVWMFVRRRERVGESVLDLAFEMETPRPRTGEGAHRMFTQSGKHEKRGNPSLTRPRKKRTEGRNAQKPSPVSYTQMGKEPMRENFSKVLQTLSFQGLPLPSRTLSRLPISGRWRGLPVNGTGRQEGISAVSFFFLASFTCGLCR